MGQLRDKIKTDPDAGLHTLRQAFFEGGWGVYGRFYAAIHRRARHLKTTMRYVHPRSESVAFSVGINREKKPARSA